MSVFLHPHLTRGVVKTPRGAFVVSRGLVEAPDEIGEALGWRAVDEENGRTADSRPGRGAGADSVRSQPARS